MFSDKCPNSNPLFKVHVSIIDTRSMYLTDSTLISAPNDRDTYLGSSIPLSDNLGLHNSFIFSLTFNTIHSSRPAGIRPTYTGLEVRLLHVTKNCFCRRQILRNHVMVRVGGGWDTLQHYLDKHDPCRCKAGDSPVSTYDRVTRDRCYD
jgi:hypothetical protein